MDSADKFRLALERENPLQILGCINAYVALMAERNGFGALYLSGAGVANSSYGLPDIGLTTLDNVLEDARRITDACSLPLLVDIDTGWGSAFMIQRSLKALEKAGAAAVHMEDQVAHKRCGHRPGKQLVSTKEMCDRIKAARDVSTNIALIARTDALAVEGIDGALERASAYVEAGAEMFFVEAASDLEEYQKFKEAVSLPILANATEFGKTPLYTLEQFKSVSVDMVLYPLSCNRAMNLAAERVMRTIRNEGSQEGCVNDMQTRNQLYNYLSYHDYENKLDELYSR